MRGERVAALLQDCLLLGADGGPCRLETLRCDLQFPVNPLSELIITSSCSILRSALVGPGGLQITILVSSTTNSKTIKMNLI